MRKIITNENLPELYKAVRAHLSSMGYSIEDLCAIELLEHLRDWHSARLEEYVEVGGTQVTVEQILECMAEEEELDGMGMSW